VPSPSSDPLKQSRPGVSPARQNASSNDLDLRSDGDIPRAEHREKTRILIVEDSEDHSELLLRQLRKSHLDGHVRVIGDGQEAWDFLERECHCDELIAVFLDLHLPSLDGIKLLRQIRGRPELATVSVIVISSSDNPADRKACEDLRVSAFVSKPVSFATFSKAVADVFHSTETQRLPRPE
jgi:CheY-like chemotaxis protein